MNLETMSVTEKRGLLQTLDVIFNHDQNMLRYGYSEIIHKLTEDINIPDELLVSVKEGYGIETLYKMWDISIQEAISIHNCLTLEERGDHEFFRSIHRIIPRAIIHDDYSFAFLKLTKTEENKQPRKLTLAGGHMRVGDVNETLFEACRRTVAREILEELESDELMNIILKGGLINHRTMKDFVYIDDEPVSCRNFGVIFDIKIRDVRSIRTKEPENHTIKVIKMNEIHKFINELDPWFLKAIQGKPYIKQRYEYELKLLQDQIYINHDK